MRMIVVDDEELSVNNLTKMLQRLEPDAEVTGFTKQQEAYKYLIENQTDIAFLDIEMGKENGVDMAKQYTRLYPEINVIFVTAYSEYMRDAFQLHVSGYLMKPVRKDDLRKELNNLRYPVKKEVKKRVRIHTFGNFEIFVDGKPLEIHREKCRECVAYLTDRKGTQVSMQEIASVLWEDEPYNRTIQNRMYQVITVLMQTLNAEGVQDIIIKRRKMLAIDMQKVECDYYNAINGDDKSMKLFHGEYMTNYSWGEFTLGELIKKGSTYN